MRRRDFIKGSVAAGSALALGGFSGSSPAPQRKRSSTLRGKGRYDRVMVLGIDGMDPGFAQRLMNDGQLPTFQKLRSMGYFSPLGTTLPPQSPVAWSSFVTGTNPGAHGIYDFIHRDPKTLLPYLSTSKSIPGSSTFNLGNYIIPLDSGRVDLMRHGVPFWDYLDEHDIPAHIYQLPANFPVMQSGSVRAVSGMGTPDLLGGYGTYTYFTEVPVANSKEFTGGRVVQVSLETHRFSSEIWGPKNPFVKGNPQSSAPVSIYRDPAADVLRIDAGEDKIVLRQGEWSGWVPLRFEFIPYLASTSGMVRFYAKKVHGNFEMYVTPVNIDPMDPALPICSPEGFSQELAENVGRFYTQGLPADTKALNEGALTTQDFYEQAKLVLNESLALFQYQLARWDEGCFVFYFSSIDQNSHMLWRCMEPDHPLYEPNASKEVKEAIRFYYKVMDDVLRQALGKVNDRTLLLALSDHGFTDFTREFHLSTWLYENGYVSLTRPEKMEEMNYFDYVDWSRTQAYAVGINGLYLNLSGREKRGSLPREKAAALKSEIAKKLLEVRDPLNGKQIIRRVYDADTSYRGPYKDLAPDLVIGYEKGYRVSDEAILGKFPRGIIGNRDKKWSADHCMDPEAMPGVFFCNKETKVKNPAIWDMAPTILKAFGIEKPQTMEGRAVV